MPSRSAVANQLRDRPTPSWAARTTRPRAHTITLSFFTADSVMAGSILIPPVSFLREVVVATVHGLELAPVDGNAGLRQQAHLAAQLDEPCTNLLDGGAVVFCGNRRWFCDPERAVPSATSLLDCGRPHAPAAGSIGRG